MTVILVIQSHSKFNTTPLGATPSTVKTTLYTSFVWTKYYFLNKEYERKEKLKKQLGKTGLKLPVSSLKSRNGSTGENQVNRWNYI